MPTHVLRYWGNRFPEVSPSIGRGSRRLYRPSDVALLAGLKKLLRDDGMTVKGVQKILRQRGKDYVTLIGSACSEVVNSGIQTAFESEAPPRAAAHAPNYGEKEEFAVKPESALTRRAEAAPESRIKSSGTRAALARKLRDKAKSLRNRLVERIGETPRGYLD